MIWIYAQLVFFLILVALVFLAVMLIIILGLAMIGVKLDDMRRQKRHLAAKV